MGFKAVLMGLAVSTFVVPSSNAADFLGQGPGGLKDAPYAEVAWNWTGFYGGWTVGYGGGVAKNYVSANGNNAHGSAENDPSGVLVGGTVGYNFQYSPNWVFGIEGDLSWSGMEGDQHKYIYDGHDWSGGWDGFGTIRGRVGYVLGGRNLVYGTAGVAFLHSNEVIVGNDADESNFAYGWYTGYVIGGGVEHVFTDHLTGKLEYLYADGFGDTTGLTGTVSQHGDQTYRHEIGSLNIVRVGLNYKFY